MQVKRFKEQQLLVEKGIMVAKLEGKQTLNEVIYSFLLNESVVNFFGIRCCLLDCLSSLKDTVCFIVLYHLWHEGIIFQKDAVHKPPVMQSWQQDLLCLYLSVHVFPL